MLNNEINILINKLKDSRLTLNKIKDNLNDKIDNETNINIKNYINEKSEKIDNIIINLEKLIQVSIMK